MDKLALSEQRKYKKIWTSVPEYRETSAADYFTHFFLQWFHECIKQGDGIIDFGCGPGRSALPLIKAGLDVVLVDICDQCLDPEIFLLAVRPKPALHFILGCLWDLPPHLKAADWAICFDVLEHIPEEKIEASLKGISLRMKKGGLFGISLREDQFGQTIGASLHLCVKPDSWWKCQVEKHFSIQEIRCFESEYLILVISPRSHSV